MQDEKPNRGNKPLGNRLFSFAVIADTHLNQAEAACNSPFEVNRLANGRMRQVVRDLNQRELAFVVNLGDLVHPVPAVPELYGEAAHRFNEQVAELKHKLYVVPGNHDVGDKPIDWTPAELVSEDFLLLWEKYFGPHYYTFDHGDCHFVTINAQIINTGFASEAAQKKWLERDLADNADKRIFINIHYPPYLCHPEEEEHYDNIADPGRSWLLGLMESHAVESLFGGHVHNFWYIRHQVTDCYLLPSTAFVRQDYSEMLKAPPPPEFEAGRNDAPKLGYFIVHVYERGHVCHFIRTYGRIAEPDSAIVIAPETVCALAPNENFRSPLGFDLRENWAQTVGIPPRGGLDEFDRKEVRNDYPLLALWEMGVRKLRVPLQDLRNPATCERMRELAHHGHRYTLFSYGIPAQKDMSVIIKNRDMLSSWEIGFAEQQLETIAPALIDAAQKTGIPLYLSKLRSHSHTKGSNEPYYHVINHGFLPAEFDAIDQLRRHLDPAEALGGVVFRITHKDPVWETIHAAASLCRDNGLKASVHLKMAGNNPAEPTCNDLWATNRIAEALAAAVTHDHLSVFVDTLVDVDRGYFVCHGVIDQLCNPRLGARVVQNLYGALNVNQSNLAADQQLPCDAGTCFSLRSDQLSHILFLPNETALTADIQLPGNWGITGCTLRKTDLGTGEIVNIQTREIADMHFIFKIEESSRCPILLTCEQ